MGILTKLVVVGIAGAVAKKAKKAYESTQLEKNRGVLPCQFTGKISQEEFSAIAKRASRRYSQIESTSVDNAVVHCLVRSQGGAPAWNFAIDFNDHGHLSGEYWITTGDKKSLLPKNLAASIQAAVYQYPNGINQDFQEEVSAEKRKMYENELGTAICPYCGRKSKSIDAKYCEGCGQRFRA